MTARGISKARMAQFRREVFPRDRFTCQECGACTVLHVGGASFVPTYAHGWVRTDRYTGTELVMVNQRRIEYFTLDHVVPFVIGGPTTPSNLRVLCQPCNSRKGAKV